MIMKKMLQSELFVVANLISFVALFCGAFIIVMSDNYRPTEDLLFTKIILWMMLFNFICLLLSIGSFESNRK